MKFLTLEYMKKQNLKMNELSLEVSLGLDLGTNRSDSRVGILSGDN